MRRTRSALTTTMRLRLAVSAVVVALLSACAPAGPPPGPTQPPAPSSSTSGPAATRTPSAGPAPKACRGAGGAQVGVFRGTDPAEVDAFEKWLGCRVEVAADFSARASWQDIASPGYLNEAWAGEPRRLALGIAMLPEDPDATMRAGAAGDYDQYFRTLGEGLVDEGHADAILRVGWEFNLDGSRWFTRDTDAFKAYWRRIADVMGSVAGSRFQFDWNPNNGKNPVDAVDYYPGDDVVDIIGVDAYDVAGNVYPYRRNCDDACRTRTQTRAGEQHIFGGDRGLRFWRDFARERGKPLSLPEWGLWSRPDGTGGGENAYYIRRMHEFIADPGTPVAYQAYFEYNGEDGEHRLMTTFTSSGAVYRQLLSPVPSASPSAS